ncbi:hypothetical protein [Actinoplanes sp. NPDC049265]|uniref:hypothetical protein n=1 Tax=Actinoplanes sp. NPDC049265 TaxID=3363902 RepID=UPI0037134331
MATGLAPGVRRIALGVTVLLIVALTGPPAYAAVGTVSTTAQGLRGNVALLSLINVPLTTPQATWTTGGSQQTRPTVGAGVPGVLDVGAITATAGPSGTGGTATSGTAGLSLLGAVSLDAISTQCTMNASTISGGLDAANLKLLGNTVNPGLGLALNAPGLLSATLGAQTATWNSGTGRLDYGVRGLDVQLLNGGLGLVAGGNVVIAESTCSGILRLGTVSTTAAQVTPGRSGTPKVTVTNTGDIAAPNTTIRVPAPPTGWTAGTATTTGGGDCTTTSSFITCTGVTVPGGGSVVVSLPVTLASSGAAAAGWAPTGTQISAVSTPVAAVTGTTVAVTGNGTLASAGPAVTDSGSITVNAMNVAAGKSGQTTLTVGNDGPSDATGATVAIPIGNRPAGVSVQSATYNGSGCAVTAATLTCTGVSVPAGGTAAITIRAAATTTTPPLTTWDLAGVQTTLNGTAVSGGGRLLTVSDPDVNLDNGVTVTPATAVPGDGAATPTMRIRNVGIIPATGTTVTVAAPPAGYSIGAVTTSNGTGTCTTSGAVTCTGVTVPAMGAVTVSIPVTLGSAVTAGWAGAVTATSGDSTGTASGPIVTADPRWTLGVTQTGPAARTVRPGQPTTMRVEVTDQGPSDAVNAAFVMVAPRSTQFSSPLTGTVQQLCQPIGPTALRCTLSKQVGDPATVFLFPLDVSAQADPAGPLDGGCVSPDDNTTCGDAGDRASPAIQLRTPLTDRITVTAQPATIVPGTAGFGRVTVSSSQDETGLALTVPMAGLPAGFTVDAATVPGGSCATGTSVVCTGVDLTAGQSTDVRIRVAVAAGVTPPRTWTATGIVLDDGVEAESYNGTLATAGNPAYDLDATVTLPPDNTVEPGDPTVVKLVVTNNGPSDAPATTFTVTAPDSTTFGTPLPAGCTADSATVVRCPVTLAAGAGTPELELPLLVDPAADPDVPHGGGCVELDGQPGCDRPYGPLILEVGFDRQVELSLNPATVTPGATATASVGVTATHGRQDGLTVVVPLAGLPPQLSVTAAAVAGGTCDVSGGNATCAGLDVADGGTGVVELTVAALPSAAQGVAWDATNVTVHKGSDAEPISGRLAVTGPPVHPLGATITPPATPLEPGDTGTLRVTVDNLGPSDFPGAAFGVFAPTGATFGTPLPAGCTAAGPMHVTCTFTITTAQAPVPFDFPLTVDNNADPDNGPLRGGCADLDDNGSCGTGDEPNPDILLTTPLDRRLTITPVRADIVPGTAGTAHITLRSDRAEDDLTVTVPTALPAGFAVTAASFAGNACTTTPAEVTCSGVDLAARTGANVDLRVTVAGSVAAGVPWDVTGIRVAAAPDDDATADGRLALTVDPDYRVTATVTVPPDGTVEPGDTTSLTLVAGNRGPSDAPATTFTVSAPAQTTFVAPVPSPCAPTGPTLVTCTVTLAANATTGPVVLPLKVADDADPFSPHGGGCVDFDHAPGCSGTGDGPIADLSLKVPFDDQATLTAGTQSITPGTARTTTVEVTAAHGDQDDLTLTVPVTMPAGLSLTRLTAPAGVACASDGTTVTCTNIDLTEGDTAAVAFQVAAAPGAAQGIAWDATGIALSNGTADPPVTLDARPAVTGPPVHPLDVTVTAPAGPVLPGGTGTATVRVDNLGPSDHPGAAIGVIAPAGTTIGEPVPAGCTRVSTTRITCTLDITAAQAPVTLAVPLTVDAGTSPGGPLGGGCADVGDDGACGGTDDIRISGMYVATPFPAQIMVSTSPATIAPGTAGTAGVVITTDPAQTGLTVRIPLSGKPPAMTVTTPAGCTADTTAITCTGVSIAPGQSHTVTLPVAVAASAPPNLVWTATGITVTDADGVPARINGRLVTTGPATYHLTATVAGPPDRTVLPGGTATMTATVGNTGPADATNAPVSVRAPVGTTFGTPVPAGCTAGPANVLTCAVTLPANGTRLTWALPVVVPDSADPAVALTGGCLDLDGDNACGGPADVALPDILLRSPLGDVVTVTATDPVVTPGRSAPARLRFTASADRLGSTLTVDTGELPAGLTVGDPSCPGTGTTITCAGVDLRAGQAYTLTMTVTAAADADVASWVPMITLAQGGETGWKKLETATVGGPETALTVDVAVPAPGTLVPGGTGDLDVTVANAGPSVLRDAHLAFRAPTGATFGTITAPGCSRTSDTVVECSYATLTVGQRTFSLPIVLSAGALPGVPVGGGCVDENDDQRCTFPPDTGIPPFVPGIALGARISAATDPVTVTPGLSGTGAVVLTATGATATSDLTVTIPRAALPGGFTVTGTGPCATTDTVITCTGVDVPGNGSARLPVTVRTDPALAAGVRWTAEGITVGSADGQSARFDGTLASTGPPVAPVTYQVTTGPAVVVEPGGTYTSTLTAHNDGPSTAAGVTVAVLAPSSATFGPLPAATAAVCARSTGNTRLNCAFTLAPDAGGAYQLPIVVNADATTAPTGGCVDLAGDGACGQGDPGLPGAGFRLRLGDAVTVTATGTHLVPGTGGSTTITVASADGRTGLSVAIPVGGLPAGVTVGTASWNNTACPISGGAVRCTGVTAGPDAPAAIVVGLSAGPDAVAGGSWRPAVTVAEDAASIARTVTAMTVADPSAPVTVAVTGPAAGTLLPGGTGEMNVTVTDAGPSNARGVVVRFIAPTGTTFAAPARTGCVLAATTRVDCTMDVPVDAPQSFVLRFQVPSNSPSGGTITGGCVDVDGDRLCAFPPDTRIPAVTLGETLPAMIQVSTDQGGVTPGGSGSGRVVLTATRPLTGLRVVVPLSLPAGFELTGFAGPTGATCVRGATTITCTGVDVVAGVNTAVTLTGTAASSLRAGVSWTATGITVSRTGQSATQIGNGPILTTGDPVAPLTLTAAGPAGGVVPGGNTTMTVTVANPGPSDADGTTVTVEAPELLGFGTPTGTTARSCTRGNDRLITCTVRLTAGSTPLSWVFPLTVSTSATDGQYVDGPCVVDGSARTCTDPIFVSQFANQLPGTVTFGFGPATIRPGRSGTGTVTLTSVDNLDGLTLSIPLADLPAVFTITGPPDGCVLSDEAITCAGLSILENVPLEIPIALSVSPSAGTGVSWSPSEIRLFRPDAETDYVTGSGMIASTSDPEYTVSVQIGTPSVPSPAAGQTTVLPVTLTNEGPSDASPYVVYFVIPTGMTTGTLPGGCAATGGRTVRCEVATIPAGGSADIGIPLRVNPGLATGTVLGGGCVDNATGQGTVDGACESNDDTLVPDLTVAAPDVDLTISILDPEPKATSGGTVRLALPYSNVGNTSASGVRFLVDPPAGVTVVKAEIVPDAGGMSLAAVRAAASAQDTVTATCVSDPDGDANAVVCTGPDAPVAASSLLYLTLAVAKGAPAGTVPVSVTISTTSPEGVTVNNTVTADLTIAAAPATVSPTATATATAAPAPDHGGGNNGGGSGWLPRTGQNIMSLVLLSFLLVLAGVAAWVAARKQRPVAGLSPEPPSRPAPTSRPDQSSD